MANVKHHLDSEKSSSNNFLTESSTHTNTVISKAEEHNDKIHEIQSAGVNHLESSCTAIKEHAKAHKSIVQDTQVLLEHGQKKRQEYVYKFNKDYQASNQQLSSTVENMVSNMADLTKEGYDKDDTHVSQTKSSMQDHCNQFYEWSEGQRSSVFQQAGKVREFWDSTYLVDTPTGATPHKTAYSYPRQLSATSPHDRIIRRFRAARPNFENDEDRENNTNF